MFAMRELSGPLSLLIEMVTYSSYCNEPFSLGVLQLLKVKKYSQNLRETTVRADRYVVNDQYSLFFLNLLNTLCLTDPAGDGSTS